MEKIEIYKSVKDHYEVVLHHDRSDINDGKFSSSSRKKEAWFAKDKYINSQEKFVEHFANKLASVHHRSNTAVIEKTGDKVSIKFFHNEKYRHVGNHWFQKNRYMMFFTLNTKTGILYSGSIHGLHNKKRKKKINTNKFWGSLSSIFETIVYEMMDERIYDNRRNFSSYILKLFFDQIPDWSHSNATDGDSSISNLKGVLFYRYFLSKKGVKLPDNFKLFEGYDFYVPAKLFKKSDNKYIDALLLHHNLSGEKFRKAFHEIGKDRPVQVTLQTLKLVVDWVGKTRLEQNPEYIAKYLAYKNNIFPLSDSTFLTESERKNIWLILTQTPYELVTIRDHINFLSFLRSKGMNFKWKAKTELEFRREHKILADTYDMIRNGVTHRIYPQGYHDWFRDPVEVGGENYLVQILDKQSEFYQESDYQQNCVKTYISKPGSFIISIRSGKERATVEYNISHSETLWHIDRVQALGRFNKMLPDSWDIVLDAVDQMVVEMIGEYGYKMTLNKEKLGKTKVLELTFDTTGRPIWDNPLELVANDDYFPF